jgi:WD40 repeat protein
VNFISEDYANSHEKVNLLIESNKNKDEKISSNRLCSNINDKDSISKDCFQNFLKSEVEKIQSKVDFQSKSKYFHNEKKQDDYVLFQLRNKSKSRYNKILPLGRKENEDLVENKGIYFNNTSNKSNIEYEFVLKLLKVFKNYHVSTVKAICWYEDKNLTSSNYYKLATAGGTNDKTIKIWDCFLMKQVKVLNCDSQVCNIIFNKDQMISSHGYSLNEIIIWNGVSKNEFKVFQIINTMHFDRVLGLIMLSLNDQADYTDKNHNYDELNKMQCKFNLKQTKNTVKFISYSQDGALFSWKIK